MATDLGIKPDAKKIYVYRLLSLITDGGGIVYRKVFTDYAVRMSGSVCNHLDKHRRAIQQNLPLQEMFNRLFPNRNPATSADKFDLTLLAFLVRVTCNEETVDEKLRSDLQKLKTFRNEIAHIYSTDEYDETKFETVWQRTRYIILQLGEGIPGLEEEIDELKSSPIDPRREAELQEIIKHYRQSAECVQDLTAQVKQLEIDQKTQFAHLEKRIEIDQTHTKSALGDISGTIKDNKNVLLDRLQQIHVAKNPQLTYPGDFKCDRDFSLSHSASRDRPSIHLEKTQQYTRKHASGLTYMETCKQMLTKGTVFSLDEEDYEDLSKVIGTQWPSVASQLGLSNSQVKRIQKTFVHNEVQTHIHEMVRIWGEIEKEEATIDRFIKAIVECPVLVAAEQISTL